MRRGSAPRAGEANRFKKRGIVARGGRREVRESPLALMKLHLKLGDPLGGSQSPGTPRVPTAGAVFAALP